jgi:broad specificity phosphatase PhoE
MGLITVVRHGQAGTFSREYDQLSDLGREQSRRLGAYWAEQGIGWDRVFIGPRARHRETEAFVAKVYRDRGLPWPRAELLEDLNEFEFGNVVRHFSGQAQTEDWTRLHSVPEGERAEALKAAFRHMFALTRRYASEAHEVPGTESWEEFRVRAGRALATLAGCGAGQRVLAFTSAGFTGMLVGCVLGLDDEKTIDTITQVRNGSYTSIMHSAERRSLTSFNSVPHLTPAMWTVG